MNLSWSGGSKVAFTGPNSVEIAALIEYLLFSDVQMWVKIFLVITMF